ncbi:hypothetical protein PO878_14505 [Iamia majanohamensis]|uniref:Uncharacterized protein n=1 Tax=Iamia majanohamensis TaxID=467976 RepID=A0AAE9Y7A2_9ACTN|nr:hypothetical protein [Iamia majanohamensis]WCO65713.1 hypothetical protein PO878_14505 [Iamia majanohamensis]
MAPALVPFPAAEVADAIAELRRVARLVDDAGLQLDTSRVAVEGDWRGGHRDDFDVFAPALVQRHGDLATQLRNLAGDLADAQAAVTRENRRRTEAAAAAAERERSCPGERVPGHPQIPC